MVPCEGLEPPTPAFVVLCSNPTELTGHIWWVPRDSNPQCLPVGNGFTGRCNTTVVAGHPFIYTVKLTRIKLAMLAFSSHGYKPKCRTTTCHGKLSKVNFIVVIAPFLKFNAWSVKPLIIFFVMRTHELQCYSHQLFIVHSISPFSLRS